MFSLQRLLGKEDKFFNLLEKGIDRCRDVGNVVAHLVLKSA